MLCGQCLKRTTLQKNYRTMTISWSFFYNSFVKLHGKKIWEPQHDCVIIKSVYSEVYYKGTAPYMVLYRGLPCIYGKVLKKERL